jgi:uncharacterized membrane protein YvlD (DUF360 family)
VVKHVFSLKVCVLCSSIFLTWTSLLVLYKLGKFHDVVILGLLTGLYYLLDKRVKPALRIFTLPFFLSLTTLFYLGITGTSVILSPLFVLLGLWVMAYIIFTYRNDPGKKLVTTAVMECCKDK